jgi:hypothetical protein
VRLVGRITHTRSRTLNSIHPTCPDIDPTFIGDSSSRNEIVVIRCYSALSRAPEVCSQEAANVSEER